MSSPTLPILTAAPSAILATAASSTDRRPLYRHFSRPCDKCGVRHSELACPVTESIQPASRIDCFTQTDPTPPCCHHQCTDDSAAQPADPQPADPQPQPADLQPQPAAPQPRQPRSRLVRSRKSSFADYLPLIRKYEAVLQKQKDDPHSTLTDLCSGIVSYNSFKEIRPIAELYIADPGTFREIYSRLKHGPVKSLKLLMKDCRDVLSTIDLAEFKAEGELLS